MKQQIKFLVIPCLALALHSCKKDAIPSPNDPTLDQITRNPTVGELNNLVTGTESGLRNNLDLYTDVVSVLGREYYRFSSSEPRYTQELLGYNSSVLDNTAFYNNNSWASRYNVIRNAYTLMLGAERSTYINAQAKKGYNGFAKTIIAYQMLLNLNQTYNNGIRVDVKDYRNLGPIVGRDAALTFIAQTLDEARTDLQGSSFQFQLSQGFAGLDDPAGFLAFNRALAARVAVYRQRWADALTALNESFFDLNGDLNDGAYHVYSTAKGDQLNELYTARNRTGEVRLAHPSFAADIEAGDDRLNKTALRNSAASLDDLTSNRDVWLYHSNTDPVAIIRNEELVLIYAEANIQLNQLPEAVTALNRIRTAHNLPVYSGAVTQAALTDEMLRQRRYSLFGEGHRWIDLRRYGRLNTLPIDRPNDDVWPQLLLPLSEQ